LADPCFETILKIEITESGDIFRIDCVGAIATMGVVPTLEAIVMKIAVFTISGFQYSGFRFMNFDGLATELACFREALIEVGATGWASMNIVVDEISIASFV
jgi:hypothetical protein